jgi:hypothetical protein
LTDAPYLSVVATSRNDDHGGSLQRRMQAFVSGWIEQCRRHQLPSELVLVEWNPPEGRGSLAEAIRWPADPGPCQIRVVTVPPEVHRRYAHSGELPLFQMIAKNVGVRRSRAPFVLATNIDILFNDEIVSFLSSRGLEKGRLYRIDRSDAPADVADIASITAQLESCRSRLIRVNGREATYSPETEAAAFEGSVAGREGISFGEGFGRERSASGQVYWSAGPDGELVLAVGDRVLALLVEAGPNVDRSPLVLRVSDASCSVVARVRCCGRDRVFLPVPAPDGEQRLRLSVSRERPSKWGPVRLPFRVLDWGWASREQLRHEGAAAESPVAVSATDVADAAVGISLLNGWGRLSWTADGELYRDVLGVAWFAAYVPVRLPGRLVLDVHSERPVSVNVSVEEPSGHGSVIFGVHGRRRLVLPVPPSSAGLRPIRVRLQADDGGHRGGGPLRVHAVRRVGVGPSLRALLRPFNPPRVDYLHTNGCGDFTLMHRDHWFQLRGYPEWESYSMNIDGFLCFAAHSAGVEEFVLRDPHRIYHIEHGLGSGWSPEGEQQLVQRITSKGIPWISKRRVLDLARTMYRRGPLLVNGEAWGLAQERFKETRLGVPA